jgi:hypothetical protein
MTTKPRARKPFDLSRRYTGELAEPIYEPILGLLAELLRPEAERRAKERQTLKLKALFDWYQLDASAPNAWRSLALVLALVHVPGMQVVHDSKQRRGRKRSWQAGLGIELVRNVEAVQARGSMTTQDAIRQLRKDKAKGWHLYTEQNLITRHREARRAEQRRRILAKQLMDSPKLSIMGGIFGRGFDEPTELDDSAN